MTQRIIAATFHVSLKQSSFLYEFTIEKYKRFNSTSLNIKILRQIQD